MVLGDVDVAWRSYDVDRHRTLADDDPSEHLDRVTYIDYRGAYSRIDAEYCNVVERCFTTSCITSEIKTSRTAFTSLATVLTSSQCYELHVDVEVVLLFSLLKLRYVALNLLEVYISAATK